MEQIIIRLLFFFIMLLKLGFYKKDYNYYIIIFTLDQRVHNRRRLQLRASIYEIGNWAIDLGCGLSSLIKLCRLRFQVAHNIATIGRRAVCQTIRNTLSRDSVTRRADFLRSAITSGESLMRSDWRYRGITNMQIWKRAFVRQFTSDKKNLLFKCLFI